MLKLKEKIFLAPFDETERKKMERVPSFTQGIKGGFVEKYEEEMFENPTLDMDNLTYNMEMDSAITLGFDAVFAGIPSSVGCKLAPLEDENGDVHMVGIQGQYGEKGVSTTFYQKGLLNTMENLEKLRENTFDVDSTDAYKKTIQTYNDYSDKIFPLVKVSGIFDRVWMGMQMKKFAYHYRKDTKLYREIIRYYGEIMIKNTQGLVDVTGGDTKAVCILDDIAFKGRLMLPPERWEKDLGQYFKEAIDIIVDAGMIPLTHTDGDVTELIPTFQKVGFRGLQGWEGGADPYFINDNYPDFVCIGFGDVSDILPFGTLDEIDSHVKDLMKALKENRHYIFGPSTVIQKTDNYKSVMHFMDCFRKYGKY